MASTACVRSCAEDSRRTPVNIPRARSRLSEQPGDHGQTYFSPCASRTDSGRPHPEYEPGGAVPGTALHLEWFEDKPALAGLPDEPKAGRRRVFQFFAGPRGTLVLRGSISSSIPCFSPRSGFWTPHEGHEVAAAPSRLARNHRDPTRSGRSARFPGLEQDRQDTAQVPKHKRTSFLRTPSPQHWSRRHFSKPNQSRQDSRKSDLLETTWQRQSSELTGS